MLTDNLIVRPINCTVNKWSKISFLIENVSIPNKYDDVQIVISTITKDYTLWNMTTSVKWLQIDNNVKFSVNLNNSLVHGLYIINQLTFQNSSNPEDQIVINEKDYLIYPFEVVKITDDKHNHRELGSKHRKIVKNRENEFNSGISFNSPYNGPMHEYMVFIFVKDCLITTPMRFGFYGLMPYEGLEFTDEINLIKRYLNRNGIEINSLNDVLNSSSNGQPTVIIHFQNIEAPSIEIAKNIAVNETEIVMNVLSVHRDSYGTIFASLVIDKLTSQSKFEPNIPSYRGNLIGGFISGEHQPEIKAHIEKSKEDKLIQLYLTFYKEALTEKTYEFSYLRLWNLLENIAIGTLKKEDYLRDYNGNVKLHHSSNNPLKVKDKINSSFHLVFEIIRRANKPLRSTIDEELIEKRIQVWNRRRNCIAHYGGCFPDNPDICQVNHVKEHERYKYITCKNARDEMIDEQGNPQNDEYLSSLKNETQNVMRYLLNK